MTCKFPSGTPSLTFPSLRGRVLAHMRAHGADSAMPVAAAADALIGWAVDPGPRDLGGAFLPPRIRGLSPQWTGIPLNGTMIAVIGEEWVSFPVHGRQDSRAVAWLAKIVAGVTVTAIRPLRAVSVPFSCSIKSVLVSLG